MRNFFRRKTASVSEHPSGVVRVDARTKKLTKRLQPGEIAIIDHILISLMLHLSDTVILSFISRKNTTKKENIEWIWSSRSRRRRRSSSFSSL